MRCELLPNVLQQADRGHLLAKLATFSSLPVDQWCPPGHPANNGQFPPWNQFRQTVSAQQAIEGLAASIPNHCIDGWSYAARSMSAILAGDAHAARHLAYYAQLRAALCILANMGVGIFNRKNYIINGSGNYIRLDEARNNSGIVQANASGMGTHEVVWKILEEWASDPVASRNLLSQLKIKGVPLKDCLDAIWPGIPATGTTRSLIEAWGIDLRRGQREHKYRNISSYSPQAMNALPGTLDEDLKFIRNCWTMFEPTTGPNCDELDRFMLRSLLLKQHRTVTGNQNYTTGPIESRYNELPPSIRALAPKNFLTNLQQPRNPILIQLAKATTRHAKASEMLARGFLLLRAATSLTYSSLVDAGVSATTGGMRSWMDPIAAARGFWPPTSPLPDPTELWFDVEVALLDFDASLDPCPTSMNDWMMRSSKGLPTIFEAERICVWSLLA